MSDGVRREKGRPCVIRPDGAPCGEIREMTCLTVRQNPCGMAAIVYDPLMLSGGSG